MANVKLSRWRNESTEPTFTQPDKSKEEAKKAQITPSRLQWMLGGSPDAFPAPLICGVAAAWIAQPVTRCSSLFLISYGYKSMVVKRHVR
jgi:hypothetical protein